MPRITVKEAALRRPGAATRSTETVLRKEKPNGK
jgi:hypothetical protein